MTSGAARVQRRNRRSLVFLVVALAGVLLAGCQETAGVAGQVGQLAQQAESAARIVVDPTPSAENVNPDAVVKVSATQGRLTSVSVRPAGSTVSIPGDLASDGASWTSTGPLALSTTYFVRAAAVDAKGVATSDTTVFSTVTPKAVLKTSISPLNGSTVGVGMPVIVRFNQTVTNKAAVERALSISTSRPIVGSWSWISAREVHYRPETFWPANTVVTLRAALAGVDAGNGVWGATNRVVRFTIGASMVSTVDVAKHTLTVRRNGQVLRVIPITTGKAGFLTRNGIKVIIEKDRTKVMDATTIGIKPGSPEYYRLTVQYAMRVTFSGEFLHAAPWSMADQGRENVSHGCVGMSMANAMWLYNLSHVGDVVQVINSPRPLEPGNGWTDWNVPWSTWTAGSALN